jgi:hypothetical protein
LPIKTICDIIVSRQALRPVSSWFREDMHQSRTGADSLNHHRLQSLLAFRPSLYRSPIAIHTTEDMVSLASLSIGGEQLVLSENSLNGIQI